MRIALVQWPAWGALPPLGLASVKAYVEQHGHHVRCFDLNIDFYNAHQKKLKDLELGGSSYGGPEPWGADSYIQWSMDYDRVAQDNTDIAFSPGSVYRGNPLPLDEWADAGLSDSPDIAGFTVYLTSFPSTPLLAREIKRRRPEVLLVFGGPNVASDREGDIALRTRIPDVVVHSEGEEALVEIADALEGHRDLTELSGLGLVVDGEPHWTEPRKLIPKIDTLPFPDFSDFDWTQYPNPYQVPIMASRGCVLNCAFCYETVYWKRFRTMSTQRIVEEIEHQVSTHPMREKAEKEGHRFYFMFADSLVNGHLKGLRRMCELLIESDVEIGWGGQARMDKRMDTDLCQKLAASGCTGLAFGLESGSQRVLESMGKHYSIEDAEGVIRRIYGAGMSSTINVMVGFPTERFRDFLDTLIFLFRTRKWIYQVSNVTTTQIALGSQLFLFPEKYGVTIHDDNSWESPDTGTEKHRQRRLRLLHRWMSLLRIPHQGIGD
jgi:radical SAM superfamily enzyme YgiQ (UPF0313 family)